MTRRAMQFGLLSPFLFWSSLAAAQTSAGLATTLVFPLSAQTPSFSAEVTLFNPGANALTAAVSFYEGNNSGAPGPKVCNDVTVSAGRSVQLTLATQCALGIGGHFGLLVIADRALPQANPFYGYMRVQTPQGQGFSVEGFPVSNFNNQVSHSTGLKRQAAAPAFQTNCFVGSLDQPVSYELRLFNDTSGAQIGGTLSGSLQPFQQFRYLDVFGANGVNAPAGDQFNVRAQFTQTSGGSANLIGFCTVQDNASLGADFRIAKSYGSPSGSVFAQGGNAFGATAVLGTTDNNALDVRVDDSRVMRYEPNASSPNLIGGHPSNGVVGGVRGATVSGGGVADGVIDPDYELGAPNRVASHHGTVGGGYANVAGDAGAPIADTPFATVAGGVANVASGPRATIAGGSSNIASGPASSLGGGVSNIASGNVSTIAGGYTNTASGAGSTVGGGNFNVASGDWSTIAGGYQNQATAFGSLVGGGEKNLASGFHAFAAGYRAKALQRGEFVWADETSQDFDPGDSLDNQNGLWWLDPSHTFNVRAKGGVMLITGVNADGYPATGVAVGPGSGTWVSHSDRNIKENFAAVDARSILDQVVKLPIRQWNYIAEGANVRHLGPVSQDFHAAFGLGANDHTIAVVDADGVALAAIQALHELVQQKEARIDALEKELASQRRQRNADHFELVELRRTLETLLGKPGDATLAERR